MKWFVVLLCILLLATGCSDSPLRFSGTVQDVQKEVFGELANLELMKNSQRVQACILKPPKPEDFHDLSTYEEGPWIDVPPHVIQRFRAAFEKPSTYFFGVTKGCIPVYGVRIRFEDENGTVDVNLCFQCDILAVVRDEKLVGGGNFDPGQPELVALCKEIFPDDPGIQKLKPRS